MDIFSLPEEEKEYFIMRLNYFLNGDRNAVQYALDILYIAHLWDDLIDKDRERTDAEINAAFVKALAKIPLNPFYAANAANLLPLTLCNIWKWQDSNELIQGSNGHKVLGYITRTGVWDIIYFCMFLTGTEDWIRQHGTAFWQTFGQDTVTDFQEFWNEVKEE